MKTSELVASVKAFMSSPRPSILVSASMLALLVSCERQPLAEELTKEPQKAAVDSAPAIADDNPSANPDLGEDDPTAARDVADSAGEEAGAPSAQQTAESVSRRAALSELIAAHQGPWFVVTRETTGLYPQARLDRRHKLGYARRGARLAVDPELTPGEGCARGWYALIGGGYVCAEHGSTDPKHPQARFPVRQPDISAVLPYTYLRNAKHGTPLYRSVPNQDQMLEYEPYLRPQAKASAETAGVDPGTKPPAPPDDTAHSGESADPDDSALATAGAQAPPLPWWQQEDIKDRLHEFKLDELKAGADGTLVTRMIRGFYVAQTRAFSWNDRQWAETTQGLIVPKDRMWKTDASEFQGMEITGNWDLPVAWVYARSSAETYAIDPDAKTVTKRRETLPKFAPLHLTGREFDQGGKTYWETIDGYWVRKLHVRRADAGPLPESVGPTERWIDVNISDEFLIAYEGLRPVYATLISSGRTSEIKDMDHTTPTGEWRIREKHITATMDGDGTAAGDLPYSIEDVPYVMYFNKAYALHAAFWHDNYGVRMSHGCVNLSPLDAKRLFRFTGPEVPPGWHGAWAVADNPGSRVVVHN